VGEDFLPRHSSIHQLRFSLLSRSKGEEDWRIAIGRFRRAAAIRLDPLGLAPQLSRVAA